MVRKIEKEKPKASDNKNKEDKYTVTISNKKYSVVLDGNKANVDGKEYDFDVKEGIAAESAKVEDKASNESADSTSIKSPLPGTVFKILVDVGAAINEGDTVLIIEAMKMETEVKSTVEGTISDIKVGKGDQVTAGQDLIWIN